MKLTVIVPAFNEEAYIGTTLDSIRAAASYLRTRSDFEVGVIVVDNNSDDRAVKPVFSRAPGAGNREFDL